jgi:hypothetical protein
MAYGRNVTVSVYFGWTLSVVPFSVINDSTGLRVLGVGVFLGILADSILVFLYLSILIRRMSSAK